MTIGFSTHWPQTMPEEYAGKTTDFVQKIWKSKPESYIQEFFSVEISNGLEEVGYPWDLKANGFKPKFHSLREDPSDRWKVGNKIHAVIYNRTKNRFQFIPVLECKSIQKVEIIYSDEALCEFIGSEPVIEIDGKPLNIDQMERLAINDGFESAHHFCHWFKSDWKGKIIHWTDLKY